MRPDPESYSVSAFRVTALLVMALTGACGSDADAGNSGADAPAGGGGPTGGSAPAAGGVLGGMGGEVGGAGAGPEMGGMPAAGAAGMIGGSGMVGVGGDGGMGPGMGGMPAAGAAGMIGGGGMVGIGGSGGSGGMPMGDGGTSPDGGMPPSSQECQVRPIDDALRRDYDLDPFYTRHASARGIPIVSSDAPVDESLTRACYLVIDMAGARDDVRQALLDQNIYFIMMGKSEKTVDTPEFRFLGDIDQRARGLGSIPAALCAEENILCETAVDRWRGESICVHEYAHTMHLAGYARAIPDFNSRLRAAFETATGNGLWANTYAGSQPSEYLAEGVQDWYNTNLQSTRPNGVHNHVNTRAELQEYDPVLYDLLSEILPANPGYRDCYYYE